jgi:hypothetical protein
MKRILMLLLASPCFIFTTAEYKAVIISEQGLKSFHCPVNLQLNKTVSIEYNTLEHRVKSGCEDFPVSL